MCFFLVFPNGIYSGDTSWALTRIHDFRIEARMALKDLMKEDTTEAEDAAAKVRMKQLLKQQAVC